MKRLRLGASALRDCAPSALSAVGARPLNFTVRFPGEAHECGMRLL